MFKNYSNYLEFLLESQAVKRVSQPAKQALQYVCRNVLLFSLSISENHLQVINNKKIPLELYIIHIFLIIQTFYNKSASLHLRPSTNHTSRTSKSLLPIPLLLLIHIPVLVSQYHIHFHPLFLPACKAILYNCIQ